MIAKFRHGTGGYYIIDSSEYVTEKKIENKNFFFDTIAKFRREPSRHSEEEKEIS